MPKFITKTKVIILTLFLLACQTPILTTSGPPPAPTVQVAGNALSAKEAWQVAAAQAQSWAADASPAEQWSCRQYRQAGECSAWFGTLASVSKQAVAEIEVRADGSVKLRPLESAPPPTVRRILSWPFSLDEEAGIVDSPSVVEHALAWLAGRSERQTVTVRALEIWSESGVVENCGLAAGQGPVYRVTLVNPDGQLCLEAQSGRVIWSSYH